MDAVSTTISIASFISSVVAVIFSIYSFRRTFALQHRPFLVFTRIGDRQWRITNIGNGPAMNVRIGDRTITGKWNNIVKCLPLGAGASNELPWIEHDFDILAIYQDIKGETYSTHFKHGEHIQYRQAAGPDWEDALDQWLLQLRLEAVKAGEDGMVSESELVGRTKWELDIMRNEYYARHGYRFSRIDLAEHFSQFAWYHPDCSDQHVIFERLSPAEKYNVYRILAHQRATSDHHRRFPKQRNGTFLRTKKEEAI
jgi:hypothetical protein